MGKFLCDVCLKNVYECKGHSEIELRIRYLLYEIERNLKEIETLLKIRTCENCGFKGRYDFSKTDTGGYICEGCRTHFLDKEGLVCKS